ncbi:hypothetical protein [Flavobacterium caeni]|uniref:Uncharacterized protein n=1 Tax=Flavobacterium caeni TaxID=490189 RepID=A0A1G5FDP4_9FLAO|nr:hypothetical protein [Flavobacterium caeni]SCY36758.1 hypothetical protein SAMN02927903_01246 [Flavobacterium caeni]
MKKIALLLFTAYALCSCDKDDDHQDVALSRTLTYDLSGTFSGSLFASYTNAGGGTTNEELTSLPWHKEITFNAGVTAANIVISGNGGTAGQQVTLVIKRGGVAIGAPVTATADASGSFSRAAPVVVF